MDTRIWFADLYGRVWITSRRPGWSTWLHAVNPETGRRTRALWPMVLVARYGPLLEVTP